MGFIHPFRTIDAETWPRRDHYLVFGRGNYPYIGVTTDIDVTDLLRACRRTGASFFNAFLHVVSGALNSCENFRYRVRGDDVVLCDAVDPSFNVFDGERGLFYFACAAYCADYVEFDARVEKGKAEALARRTLMADDDSRQDVFYVSCLPWFGFTDVIQPMGLSPDDAIPRVVWGKYRDQGGRTVMPLSITGHHGLFDGYHIAVLLDAMHSLMNDKI